MSILGKILAFLNILGVAGFLVLGSMTLTKRQSWELANLRADLISNVDTLGSSLDIFGGLPIDKFDMDKSGVYLVNKIPEHVLNEMFPGDPKPPDTQVAEVIRVRGALTAQLNAAGDDVRKKNLILARLLMPMGGSYQRYELYGDREFYLSMQAQLGDDKKYAAFIKVLGDAIPIAVSAMRFDPKRASFEKEFQKALEQLPGEDKWKLAELFLNKLPSSLKFTKRSLAFAQELVKEINARDVEYQKEEDALAEKAKRGVRVLDKNLTKATGQSDVAAATKSVVDAYQPLVEQNKTFGTPEAPATLDSIAQELGNNLGPDAKNLLGRRIVSDMIAERFEEAAAAAKKTAEDLEKLAQDKLDAQDALQAAKSASLIADFESKTDPKDKAKEDLAKKLKDDLPAIQAKFDAAEQAAKMLPEVRAEAAVVFLQALRKDDKKNDKPQADYIKGVVETVVTEALNDVHAELTTRFEQAYKDAAEGKVAMPDAAPLTLVRDRRRQAIAGFLFAAIDVLADEQEVAAFQTKAILVDKADPERKWKFENATVEPAAYRRFVTVVGVESAVGAVKEQEAALLAVIDDVNERIHQEKYNFRKVHHARILALKQRADDVFNFAAQVAEVARQANDQLAITQGERDRVDKYIGDVKDARGDTAKEMQQLYKLTNELIKVRVAIRNAIENNQKNLILITELEKEVLALQREVAAKEKADRENRRRQP